MTYRVSLIRPEFVDRVRRTGLDDQGQPVRRFRAAGGEPVRDLARRARPGEELLLASYGPFTQPGPFRELGPVYVAADASPDPRVTSLTDLIERRYLNAPFVLRAYAEDGDIADAAVVPLGEGEARLAALLPGAAFVDARFAAFGCWAARFTRAA